MKVFRFRKNTISRRFYLDTNIALRLIWSCLNGEAENPRDLRKRFAEIIQDFKTDSNNIKKQLPNTVAKGKR